MSVSIDLSGRVAIVTGGGSGIGRETSQLLARAGASVAVADKNKSAAQETAELITKAGGQAVGVEVDVTEPDAAAEAVESTVQAFGAVNILVNNAAAWTVGLFKDITKDEYVNKDIGVSLVGTMVMTRAVFDVMRENGGGSIVNLISDSARVGEPYMVAYGAAKGGVISFTKGFAKEAARSKIRVNAVSPGTTKTPGANPVIDKWGGEEKLMAAYPLRRLGEPIDQANAILFFCSDMSSWVTGQVLSVNGGYAMVG
ncbi:MAG TPA: SDR family oxidoreductase [Pseudonocardia sp.]|jgi:NAD(P)-dependent dehydrogenase (short-subunit alcohol dehydrogenase family)